MYHCKYYVHFFKHIFRMYMLFKNNSFICLYVYIAKSANIAKLYQTVLLNIEKMNKYLFIIPFTVFKRRLVLLYDENTNEYLLITPYTVFKLRFMIKVLPDLFTQRYTHKRFVKFIVPNRYNQVQGIQVKPLNDERKKQKTIRS